MRRRLTVLLVIVGMMMFSLMPVASADAHTGPCDSGREYAQEHIVPLAKAGVIGQLHKPGTHRGFSNVPAVCLPD